MADVATNPTVAPQGGRPEPTGTRNPDSTETGRGLALATYVAGAATMEIPDDIMAAAKTALIDFAGCGIGAIGEPAAVATRRVADQWRVPGKASFFGGGTAGAPMVALVNGTATHCMDFDDTHLWGGGHISAPCWSAALAVAEDHGRDELAALRGFLVGYEVMARLGGGGIRGVGRSMQQRGFHPTAVNGVTGAAAAAAAVTGMDTAQALNALSVAATGAGGLVASFGSDSKPFHAGRAAMEGILARDLAANGFNAAPGVFERENAMLDTFIQDRSAQVPEMDFSTGWEILNNGYKPFACCRATHASIQAAHSVAERVGTRAVKKITAQVHYNAPFTAGKPDPQTPLECKFSVPFTIGMALTGHACGEADFNMETVGNARARELCKVVELKPIPDQPQYESYLTIELADGEVIDAQTRMFLGHPDNPMNAAQRDGKFLSLAVPVLGQGRAEDILGELVAFEAKGALGRAMALIRG